MSTILCLCRLARAAVSAAKELTHYLLNFIQALLMPRAKLGARLLAAESQLAVHKHRIRQRKEPRPRFTPAFRFLWVWLSLLFAQWKDWAQLMQPATVKRWHTRTFRRYWRGNHGAIPAGLRYPRRCRI